MDVLQVIKDDHESIRKLLISLAQVDKVTERRRLYGLLQHQALVHMRLEGEYLYPEVLALFADSEVYVSVGQANHKILSKHLNALGQVLKIGESPRNYEKVLEELRRQFEKHFESEERLLMPRVRQLVPTLDREELGQVFLDVKEQLRFEPLDDEQKQTKAKSGGRSKKRA